MAQNIWYKNPILLFFVIGMPLFVVVVCIWFIVYAVKHQDPTVRDDWYMDGKALYQDASKDELTHTLGLGGVMHFDGKKVNFELNYPKDSPLASYPKELLVAVSHATKKDFDRDFVLTHDSGNRYQGTLDLADIHAYYYLQITPNDGDQAWRLLRKQKLPAKTAVFVPLAAFDQPQDLT